MSMGYLTGFKAVTYAVYKYVQFSNYYRDNNI